MHRAQFLEVVHEVTAWPVGAEAYRVKGAAEFGLVLWMTCEISEFIEAVGELALVAVLADATLFKRSTELGLVA